MSYKKVILITIFCISTQISHPKAENILAQIESSLLKNISLSDPSESEQNFINCYQTIKQYGTHLKPISEEILKTIENVSFLSEVLPRINRTSTNFGYISLAQKAVSLTDDINSLNEKRKHLKTLQFNKKTCQKIISILQKVSNSEHAIASESLIKKHSHYWDDDFIFKSFNKRSFITEITYRKAQIAKLSIMFLYLTSTIQTIRKLPQYIPGIPQYLLDLVKWDDKLSPFDNALAILKKEQDAFGKLISLISIAMTPYGFYKSEQSSLDDLYKKQETLIALNTTLGSIKSICNLIKENSQLQTVFPQYFTLKELFDNNSKKTSSDLKNLIKSLMTSSFEGKASYFLSLHGTTISTYYYFTKAKHELVPYIQLLGDIDAHLAIFSLYEELKEHHNAKICLPTFIHSDTPQLIAQEFWHPIIGPKNVVTNDIAIGEPHHKANLIITGPNAGGKTTMLTALIVNIIMAQTLGIAPATSLTITPFTKIHSYLDVTTNLVEGKSLFKAEAERAKKLKESILACAPYEKAFTIIDEIFSGTAADAASQIGFKFAQQLGKIKNSMAIITTHFPRLTDLERETNYYKNYKVADATIQEDGSITYPFKLVPGKSTQNIAQQILLLDNII